MIVIAPKGPLRGEESCFLGRRSNLSLSFRLLRQKTARNDSNIFVFEIRSNKLFIKDVLTSTHSLPVG